MSPDSLFDLTFENLKEFPSCNTSSGTDMTPERATKESPDLETPLLQLDASPMSETRQASATRRLWSDHKVVEKKETPTKDEATSRTSDGADKAPCTKDSGATPAAADASVDELLMSDYVPKIKERIAVFWAIGVHLAKAVMEDVTRIKAASDLLSTVLMYDATNYFYGLSLEYENFEPDHLVKLSDEDAKWLYDRLDYTDFAYTDPKYQWEGITVKTNEFDHAEAYRLLAGRPFYLPPNIERFLDDLRGNMPVKTIRKLNARVADVFCLRGGGQNLSHPHLTNPFEANYNEMHQPYQQELQARVDKFEIERDQLKLGLRRAKDRYYNLQKEYAGTEDLREELSKVKRQLAKSRDAVTFYKDSEKQAMADLKKAREQLASRDAEIARLPNADPADILQQFSAAQLSAMMLSGMQQLAKDGKSDPDTSRSNETAPKERKRTREDESPVDSTDRRHGKHKKSRR